MYFLKEMESIDYIEIDRLSCASVSSIIALCYVADCLDLFSSILYRIARDQFNNFYNLNKFSEAFNEIRKHLPEDICNRMNNKVFISYYNCKKRRKITKSTFSSVDEIFETIQKSCFFPFLIDGNVFYKKKYVDGIVPKLLEPKKSKTREKLKDFKIKRRSLYIDLFGYDIIGILNIKNEQNNYCRVLNGLLDAHLFFISGKSSKMCSYIEYWSFSQQFYFMMRKIVEYINIYILFLIYAFFNKSTQILIHKLCLLYKGGFLRFF